MILFIAGFIFGLLSAVAACVPVILKLRRDVIDAYAAVQEARETIESCRFDDA